MEVRRLVSVTSEDLKMGNPIHSAVQRCWPEAKYVSVINGEIGINFANEDPSPYRGCLYVTLPEHIFNWYRTYEKMQNNPDMKLKVEPIVFGLCFDESFLKSKHVDRLSNDTLVRPSAY